MIVIITGAVWLGTLTMVAGLIFFCSMYYAWQSFIQLFKPITITPWYYPVNEPAVPSILTDDKISVSVQLPEDMAVDHTVFYSLRVPAGLSIAMMFYYLYRVQLKYQLILPEYLVSNDQGWVFYSLSRSGVRKATLNPEQSMQKNGVRENSIIEAVRISAHERHKSRNHVFRNNANRLVYRQGL